MAVTIADTGLVNRLKREELTLITDGTGRVVGRFLRLRCDPPNHRRPPLTRDQIAALLSGRPNGSSPADVLSDLEGLA